MNIPRSVIRLENLQFKSPQAIKQVARGLSLIEEAAGIHSVRIAVENPFVCSWIDLEKQGATEMESLLRSILEKVTE